MTNKDYIVAKFERVSNLSDTISDDAVAARRAFLGLLTSTDRGDRNHDIDVLLDALEGIRRSANMISWAAEDARRELGKEDHNTTK